MLIGYARVSKADGSQSLDLQRAALRAEGIDDVAYLYHDFASRKRPQDHVEDVEHITTNDEAAKDRLMKGLDSFLERDRDRSLFDLPQKTNTIASADHSVEQGQPDD